MCNRHRIENSGSDFNELYAEKNSLVTHFLAVFSHFVFVFETNYLQKIMLKYCVTDTKKQLCNIF